MAGFINIGSTNPNMADHTRRTVMAKSHKELIIEYLLEGNSKADLAEYAYDLMSQSERNEILDDIDNIQLDQDTMTTDPTMPMGPNGNRRID